MTSRYVMDTSVLIAALRSADGASYRFLEFVPKRRFQLMASTSVLLEYESVILRPDHTVGIGRSVSQNQAALAFLAQFILPVESHRRWRPQLRDPDDEHILEAAINGRADAIVTHNVKDFTPQAANFDIRVLRPRDIIQGGELL